MKKEHKLLHYCQNIEAHNGLQHGFYVNLGKRKISARLKHLFRKKKIIPVRCPQCKSKNVKIGRLYTGREDG